MASIKTTSCCWCAHLVVSKRCELRIPPLKIGRIALHDVCLVSHLIARHCSHCHQVRPENVAPPTTANCCEDYPRIEWGCVVPKKGQRAAAQPRHRCWDIHCGASGASSYLAEATSSGFGAAGAALTPGVGGFASTSSAAASLS